MKKIRRFASSLKFRRQACQEAVEGGASLTGNSAGTAISQVAANHIGGPLACSGNTPPTDDNQPNTVSGPASGQCAGLA